MSRVKHVTRGDGDVALWFVCPGCGDSHVVGIGPKPPTWTWDGSFDHPTLSPSILVTSADYMTDADYERLAAGEAVEPRPLLCHSFVRNGRIEFLSDCTHALAGTTVDLPEIPE
ncbi:ammonia monooxygenase [Pseudoxanthomonas winnipegensis]|uniref:Ammonia monooxygenase n=1 Tax=Pseudoxanthomonas winnipegensis TaxID=2480810 RepID=A0ABY1WB27_9GAMM|nr:DUF6527 family protein [Pseudoxanthomonas winnipegensis]TAA18202.1 ammonia monooxygenase [Pseudoxanthomonas winnipegensis]